MFLSAETQAQATVGATVPFTTYEAEAGTLGGGATVVSLTAPPPTQYSSPALEASGHAYVQLTGTGQSVTWTNNTGKNITAMNVRASIPDAPTGGGITATVDLYVNGTLRQAINLNSKQSWIYEGNGNYNGNDKNPADGNPKVFYDEVHFFITGAAIAPGSTIMLKKDSANAASFYYIDCVDLETPPAPLTQPANSLSITSYGAVANNSSFDSTSAIQNCINAAQSSGQVVWIPQGTFYVKQTGGLSAKGITMLGAGAWYSTLYRLATFPSTSYWGNTCNFDSCTVKNLCLDDNAIDRDAVSGACPGAMDMGGSNWLLDSIWIQHSSSGFWVAGTNGTIQNCRIDCNWADGINLNNIQDSTVGNNLTAQNNFVRGNGDDAFAVYCYVGGSNQQMQNPTIINNTSVASWGGKGVALYGGQNVVVKNNLLRDSARYVGLGVGYFSMNAPIQGALVQNNVILRCGGNGYDQQQAAVDIGTNPPSWYTSNNSTVETVSNAIITGNTISNPLFGAVAIHSSSGIVLQNNVINSPSLNGVTIDSTGIGNAVLDDNILASPASGRFTFFNDAPGYTVQSSSVPVSTATAASSYNSANSVGTETCSEGGLDVEGITNGSYTVYNSVNLNSATSFSARVASAGSGGNIAIHLDSPTGTLLGTAAVPVTGDWQAWTTVSCGLSGANGYHNVYLVYTGGSGALFNVEWFALQGAINGTEASSYNSANAVGTETCSEGGLDVDNIANGSYTVYNNVDLNGIGGFQARVASAGSGGSIAVHLDSPTGTLLGTATVPVTGGWQNWATVSCGLTGASGFHNVYLVYTGGSGALFNVEWFALQGAINGTEASSYNNKNSVQTENCAEGGLDVGFIGNGSYTEYNNVNLNNKTSFAARVASPGGGSTIAVHLDSPTGTLLGTATVPVTGGWQNWTTVSCNLSGASGYHNVYLVYTSGMNIEWFALQGDGPATVASSYNSANSARTASCTEGGLYVGWLSNGSYTEYNSVNLTGMTDFQVRVASWNSGGTITIHLDSPTGTVIGTVSAPITGAPQNWATVNGSLTGASGYHNVYLVYATNGVMNIQWFTFQGGFSPIAASSYASLNPGTSMFLEGCSEGGNDLANINNGDYAVYNNIDLTGTSTFVARVASLNNGGTIVIHLDSPTGTVIGTCTVPITGGWQTWTTVNCPLSGGSSGTHNVYLVFTQGGFNLEWFNFQ